MRLQIDGNCPGCGAAVQFTEEQRLLLCPYCHGRNYLVFPGRPQLLLLAKRQPPGLVEAECQFYIPYLRFKGMVFNWDSRGVQSRLVDTSRLAMATDFLPASLGLRPQAMQLVPASSSLSGHFCRAEKNTSQLIDAAVQLAVAVAGQDVSTGAQRAYIGETVSTVYQPLYQYGRHWHDGLTGRLLGPAELFFRDQSLAGEQHVEQLRFLSLVCPACGSALAGESDSLVVSCPNCQTCWQEHAGELVPLSWACVEGAEEHLHYLPFWRLNCSEERQGLKSLGDFFRFLRLPVVNRAAMDQPLALWIPAFKVQPQALLQVARQISFGQLRLPATGEHLPPTSYPVTLPVREAKEAILPLIASILLGKPFLAGKISLQFSCQDSQLIFLPFASSGHDYHQLHSGANIQAVALRHGRSL